MYRSVVAGLGVYGATSELFGSWTVPTEQSTSKLRALVFVLNLGFYSGRRVIIVVVVKNCTQYYIGCSV